MKRIIFVLPVILLTLQSLAQLKQEIFPPTNLRNGSDYLPSHVDLIWTPPADWQPSRVDRWFEYDRGIYVGGGIGSCPGCPVEIAIRWDSNYFNNYNAVYLTKIRYLLLEAALDHALRVYQSYYGVFDTLFDYPLQQNLVYFQFDTLEFSPITIDKSRELWVGLWVSDMAPGYPLSFGIGPYPQIEGYGNMIKLNPNGNWQTLTEINPELNYTWQLGAYIETPNDAVFYPVFNVFRSIDEQPFEKIHEGEIYDTIFHDDMNEPAQFVVKYYVNSVYKDDSSISSDTLAIWLVNVPENMRNDRVIIYPNPAKDVVTIHSVNNRINSLSLINTKGETVLIKKPGTEKTTLDVSDLPDSFYVVKINTIEGISNSKLLIIK
ncbi:MAG TPA: T9SS type A sorting domain-containing protein [Bacteroidales bacterium]|nr:T9SS type A sorting domain-containing protein [Bacteroidales bacterium]